MASSLPWCSLRSRPDDQKLWHALVDTYEPTTALLQQLEISHSFAGTRLDVSNRFPWHHYLRWPVSWCHALAPCLSMTEIHQFLIILTRMTPSGILTHTTHNLSSSAHPRPAGARISSSWRPSACSTAPLLPAGRRWLYAPQASTSWAMAVLLVTWDEWSPQSSHHHKRGSF